MSDAGDLAQERETSMRDVALEAHRRRLRPPERDSARLCRSCGDAIEEGRRAAVPGTQICAWCARQISRG